MQVIKVYRFIQNIFTNTTPNTFLRVRVVLVKVNQRPVRRLGDPPISEEHTVLSDIVRLNSHLGLEIRGHALRVSLGVESA